MKVCLFYEKPQICDEMYGVMVSEDYKTIRILKKKHVEISVNNKGGTLSTYNRYRKVEMFLRQKEGHVSDENGVFPVYYDLVLVAGKDQYRLRFKSEELARYLIDLLISKGIATLNSSS